MYISLTLMKGVFLRTSILEKFGLLFAIIAVATFIVLIWRRIDKSDTVYEVKSFPILLKAFGFALFTGIVVFIDVFFKINLQLNEGYLGSLLIYMVICLFLNFKKDGFLWAIPYFLFEFICGSLVASLIGWIIELFLLKLIYALLPIFAIVFVIWLCTRGGSSGNIGVSGSQSANTPEYVYNNDSGKNYRVVERNNDPGLIEVIDEKTGKTTIARKSDLGGYVDNNGNWFHSNN